VQTIQVEPLVSNMHSVFCSSLFDTLRIGGIKGFDLSECCAQRFLYPSMIRSAMTSADFLCMTFSASHGMFAR
jgi:hypothetical protein